MLWACGKPYSIVTIYYLFMDTASKAHGCSTRSSKLSIGPFLIGWWPQPVLSAGLSNTGRQKGTMLCILKPSNKVCTMCLKHGAW